MADLFALTADTAARLSRLLDAGPRAGGAVPSNGWATAVVARCGGPDAANPGLYAAALVWHDSADWQAGTAGEVRLGELDGLPLSPGDLYLATGGGRTASDEPVYWTHARPGGSDGSGGSAGDDGVPAPVPVTSLVDFCLDGTGGGRKRFRTTDPLTGAVLSEWCEDILPCGSGDLCDDLPPAGSGSSGPGSGGGGEGGTAECCSRALNATLYFTFTAGGSGTVSLAWDGSVWVSGSFAFGTCSLRLRFNPDCTLDYEVGGLWHNAVCNFALPAVSCHDCGPPYESATWASAGSLGGCGVTSFEGTLSE